MAFYSFSHSDVVYARTIYFDGSTPATFRSVSFTRGEDDSASTSDALAIGRGYTTTSSDTVTASDSYAYDEGFGFSEVDSVSVSDAGSRRVTSERTQSEVVTVFDVGTGVRGLFVSGSDTVSVSDSTSGLKQYWPQGSDTVTVSDAHVINIGIQPSHSDTVTVTDSVSVLVQPRPGVGLLLRPYRDGTYQGWAITGADTGAEALDDTSPDGDTTKISLDATAAATDTPAASTFEIDPVLIPVGSPQRIVGITVHYVVKGENAQVQPRLLLHGWEYDGEAFGPPGAGWFEKFVWFPVNVWGSRPWSSSDLLDLEVGLVNAGDQPVDLTMMAVHVAVEPTPLRLPLLDADGASSDWSVYPSTGKAYSALQADDADRSYVTSSTASDALTARRVGDIFVPDQFQIDKVQLSVRARGSGTITPLVVEEGYTHTGPYHGDWELELGDSYQTYQVPFPSRPRFSTGESRWTLSHLLEAEYGVQNSSGGEAYVSHLGLELYASLRPEGVEAFRPSSNGTYQEWTIVVPNTGESAYEDVNSDLPDDTSYLRADATVSKKMVTFGVASTASENWYGVRWRCRVRKEPGQTAKTPLSPVFIINSEVYVGRPLEFDHADTSGFVELIEDFWVNPFNGLPWGATDLQTFEVGALLWEGRADMAWCAVDAGVVPPRAHGNDAVSAALTTTAEANIARANADALVWKVDKFQIGRGGFQQDNPAVVLPVEPDDDELADPIRDGKVLRYTFNGTTAYYWCAIPPNILSDPIGEIMLMARIVSSNNAADTVGSYFPLAAVHFPAGFHTLRSIRVLRVAVTYGP